MTGKFAENHHYSGRICGHYTLSLGFFCNWQAAGRHRRRKYLLALDDLSVDQRDSLL